MTLHKTDHLSEKDIQKRKSTFSNFELQAAFFLALISKSKRLMMSEDFFYSFPHSFFTLSSSDYNVRKNNFDSLLADM